MKAKLIAVLVAVAALFIGAVLWRTDSFVYGDRISWVESQTRTQLGAMNHSLMTELKSLQRVVSTFNAENFQKGKMNWSSLAPYYAAASFSVSGENLEPQVLLTKENSKAANWTKEFVKTALGPMTGRSSDVRFFVKPFQDTQRGRYVGLVFVEDNKAYALFGSGEVFQSLIDAQRGALSSFSIVTSSGLTVGHSVPEYLGTLMRDDPVFKEAAQSGASHGSNIFKLKSGDLYGMYEMVPQSNLFVLSSAPLNETMKGRKGLWWQFLLMGCGLALVGIAGSLWIIMPAEKKMETLEEQIAEARAKAVSTPVLEKAAVMDPEVTQKEKVEASMRVASALAHEMRGPLASILGYSQMILAKEPGPEVAHNADSIIRETRAARGVLDKLLGYAGEEVKEKNTMKLEGPLVKALKELDSVFSKKGVKVIKNIQDTSSMELHVDAIIRAVTHILQNSVEAMERMAKKEVKVDLFEDAQGIHLVVEDTGEGIEPQNLEKIFDPFFTTRSFQNHMGLGLSVAFGILKEHNADIQVESQRGRGTKVMVLFKKQQSVDVLKAPEVKEEEVIMIPAELPQLKEESVHREEAENEFAEIKAATPPSSPLDINIDNLLELPEIAPVKPVPPPPPSSDADDDATVVVVEAKKLDEEATVVQAAVPAKSSPVSLFGDDEITFIDGFMDSEKPKKAPVPPPPPVDAMKGPTSKELAEMNDELTAVNPVVPPKMAAKPKASKLDSYHVEIRRPGKRI